MALDRPLLLLLALTGPAWWFLRARWLDSETKRLREFVRPALWDRVEMMPPPPRTASRILWSLALCLWAVAAAGPRWGAGAAFTAGGGDNVAIALDVSASMASADEVPSRLGRASAEILRLMDRFRGVRFSLVLFSSRARLAVPGTLDSGFLASRLPRTPWEETGLPPGTELGTMVDAMIASLPGEELETRTGVIFSDGGFHDFSVERSVEAARQAGLRLVCAGVGGLDSVPLPSADGGFRIAPDGDTLATALVEEPLRELAERTGGFYVRLSGTDDFPSLLDTLIDLSRSDLESRVEGAASGRRFQIFLAAGLALVLVALALEARGL